MIVVAIICLLCAIAIPKLVKTHEKAILEGKATQTITQIKVHTEGGGWDMFRFIELLGVLVILWFIANFVRFIAFMMTGMGEGSIFGMGMSDSWIEQYKAKKEKAETKSNNRVDELRKKIWKKGE
jgi:uncharacterized membrane protein YobD (UPF0266 family)